jgi:cyclopropane fatty-acyl-phospholipid synthase-like methyltransferase
MTRALVLALMLLAAGSARPAQSQIRVAPTREPDVIYLPTPHEAVTAMLKLANVGPGDIVYDLGSGDGRILITAVKDFGAARGVGIDIDPAMIREGTDNAERARVTDRVRFLNEDLFDTDLHEATVVTLYLLPWLNRQLIPKLKAELKPGARIIAYRFAMGDWKPEQTITVNGQMIYFWRMP